MNKFVIEDVFDYKGYYCVCIFNRMGFRCGYVGVNEYHSYYGKDYHFDGPNEIDCHWGLTYAGKAYFEDSNLWYFGFDCGHCTDIPDMDLALKYGLIDESKYEYAKQLEEIYASDKYSSVKDLDFVRENCKIIAEQLYLIEKRGN